MMAEDGLTLDNVQHYCRHSKELKNTQVSKALKLVEHDCLKYIGDNLVYLYQFDKFRDKYAGLRTVFVCLPLNTEGSFDFFGLFLPKKPYRKDYNSSEYIIFKNEDDTFECNCQGWQTLLKRGEIVPKGANCSHVLALYYCFKLRKKWGTK